MNDLKEFCENFDIVDNALKMRQMIRWNGRDLRNRENLSEHTHLVIACAIHLISYFNKRSNIKFDELLIIKAALLHDGLEMLRGDILSITKDAIPGLRDYTDCEEEDFMYTQLGTYLCNVDKRLLQLADLMACYKFIETEIRYPSNNFAHQAYIDTKNKYDKYFKLFCNDYDIDCEEPEPVVEDNFIKGYADDAGVDIILNENVTFMPLSTNTINLNVKITPSENEMAFLCARTSAANKGLVVATCPIDPNYTGFVSAIVHNVSNDIISYYKGEAFCQYVMVRTIPTNVSNIKKLGKRSDSAFGGTDK